MPKFLFKANNNVLSHCSCVGEPAMSTGQLDCPWCGCGWLISCSKCKKAFTFAQVCSTDVSLAELGRREADARGLTTVTEDQITAWVSAMSETMDCFDVGDIVVYLDGSYWTVDATSIEFDGYYASHKLDRLPHAEALSDPARLEAVLGSPDYWLQRERMDRDR